MSDPYCLEFIEAMVDATLAHSQQGENPHAQEPLQS